MSSSNNHKIVPAGATPVLPPASTSPSFISDDGFLLVKTKSENVADPSGGSVLTIRVDESNSGYTFIGEAVAGTLTSDSNWRIKKVTDNGTVTWPTSDPGKFNKVWDDRNTITFN